MKSGKSFAAPWKFLGIVVFFVVLTILLTYPLSTHLASSLRDIGDSYEYAWVLGFGAFQLLHDPLHLYSGNIFYPFPLSLAYSDSTVPSIVLGAPIIWLTNNPILAHNVVLLLTFALGGIGMYLLVAERTNSTLAAVVAGILYGFTPYRFDHLAQIPNVSMEWAPFALWCFERYFRKRQQRWAAGFAFFSVLQVLVSFYYAFILGVGIAIYVVARLLGRDRSWLSLRWLGPFLGYGALGAAVATPFILPYFTVEHTFGLQRSLEEAVSFSAWPANYLASSSLMRVILIAPFDRLLLHFQPGLQLGASERQLYPGLTIVVLSLVAGFRRQARAIAPALMIVVGVVLSFGPVFHPSAGSSLPSLDPMPYTILFNDLPGFAALRVPSRFAALVIFGLAILAGDGLAFLLDWLPKRRPALGPLPTVRALGVACLVLAVVEGAASLPTHPVLTDSNVPPVYQWLAQQPHPSPVVELPIDANAFVESPRSYYSTYDHQPLVNGFRSFDPPAYGSLVADLSTFPSGQAVSTMTWLGVRYVVVHQGELSSVESTKLRLAPVDLPIAARFGDDVVYELPPLASPEALALDVIQPSGAVRTNETTTLKAVLQRRDNGRTIVFAPGTQQLSFQMDWQGANQATFQEVVRVPIPAIAENSPASLDLAAHAPKQAGRYAVTVTLIDQPNASARFTIPSFEVESTSSIGTGSASSNPAGSDVVSTTPTLLQAILPVDRLTDATSVPYLLNWRVSGQTQRPLVVFVNVYDGQNRYWSFPRGTETHFSSDGASAAQVVAEVDSVPLKPDMPPGHYSVEAGLLDAATNQRVPFVGPNGDQVTRVVLGSFWLLPSNVIPSSGNLRLAAGSRVFGGQIALDSAQVVGTPSPGGNLRVDLRWSAREVPKADYTAFVHVLDSTGKLVAQVDAQPTGGVYPTSAWLVGDTIVDSMTVQLPANLPPGPYQIQVGLYDLKTMQRLPVTANGTGQGDVVVIQP